MTLEDWHKMSEQEIGECWITDQRETTEQYVPTAAALASASLMKRFTDGPTINKDPLTEIPEPEMRLYGIFGTYFESQEELESHCRSKGFSTDKAYVLDYFRNLAGCSDVIREINSEGRSRLYTAVDEDGYGIYNPTISARKKEFVWEFKRGKIRDLYSAFRTRGIVFEDDVYGEIDERNEHPIQMRRMQRDARIFGSKVI